MVLKNLPYRGGAIKFIFMGISGVDNARPDFKAALTASIPS